MAKRREIMLIDTISIEVTLLSNLNTDRNVIPIHVHVEAEIAKGKYGDYETFLGREAVQNLRLYLAKKAWKC